ncbi:putative ribonuclease H protein [Vitis vinifera]|uniref:Putative ribonuclease H protein n=1 Tax=Vitis vinifera TaxID=29760 RepID=A0A438EBT1_VITVI|nr:putative ribonuclease H protein [Vitis vinifera]
MANAHRKRNQLTRVKVNGRWLTKESEIKEVSRAFQEGLDKPFSEEEVFGALSGFCGEKASGSDDFSMAFCLNATFLVLIPKKGETEELKDFRAISLVGGLYKWLAKVLANRMKGVLAKSSRGLRQGDPLSPYLFVVVVEAFSCMMKRAVARGLRANLEKSEMIPVGRVENVEELADEFGYKVGKLPSTYLGMPLGAPFKSVVTWDGIEERFQKILAMWKRQYISKGGRITLIRSILFNLAIYFMSIFQLPRVVRMRLGQIQRDFLWGGGALEQKPHLVRWPIVCVDKSKGGKYGEERGGWRSCEVRKAYGVGLWKAITTSKEAWVNEIWTAEGERRGSWTPRFNRPFNDWEMEEVGRLLCCLDGKKVRVDEEDRVRWMDSKDGVFSVKSLYRALQPVPLASFPSKIIWNSCVQPKLSFFAWEVAWEEF